MGCSLSFVKCDRRHEAHRSSATGHQARIGQIVGAENYDGLFAGVVFSEVADKILYAFAPTEDLATEIEDNYALHLSIVASQVTGVPVEYVQVPPAEVL
jgi:hypothetical protein